MDEHNNKEYLFTSERLGFRGWLVDDVAPMTAINADAEVMQFFPATQDEGQTAAFVGRMQQQLKDKGYCYFAVHRLEDSAFIGFIGLSDQVFEAGFTPCVDIGWRLGRHAWHNGYASEGAKRCLEYGFGELGMTVIYAIAPKLNVRSEQVMRKIGMMKAGEFVHPLLAADERLRDCVLYEVSRV